jgi:hypothetical protein
MWNMKRTGLSLFPMRARPNATITVSILNSKPLFNNEEKDDGHETNNDLFAVLLPYFPAGHGPGGIVGSRFLQECIAVGFPARRRTIADKGR